MQINSHLSFSDIMVLAAYRSVDKVDTSKVVSSIKSENVNPDEIADAITKQFSVAFRDDISDQIRRFTIPDVKP